MNIEIAPPLVKERLIAINNQLQKAIDSFAPIEKNHQQEDDFAPIKQKKQELEEHISTNLQYITCINQHLETIPYFNQAQIEEQIIRVQNLITWSERVDVDPWYLRQEQKRWEEKRERLLNFVLATKNLNSDVETSCLKAEMLVDDLEKMINSNYYSIVANN